MYMKNLDVSFHNLNFPTHFESSIDSFQHFLFIFGTAMSEYIKTRSGLTLSMPILFVLSSRDDIDATEPNIQFTYPHQACFYDSRSKGSSCIVLLEY